MDRVFLKKRESSCRRAERVMFRNAQVTITRCEAYDRLVLMQFEKPKFSFTPWLQPSGSADPGAGAVRAGIEAGRVTIRL